MFPAYMTAMRSTSCACRPMSWPIRIIETPSRCLTSSSVCATTRCTTTSSALVGSSAMISGGCSGDGHGDADALLHAAAQLVRIQVVDAAGNPTMSRSRMRSLSAWPLLLVRLNRVGDLLLDAHHWVERVHGALRNERQLAPAHRAQLLLGHAKDVVPVDQDLAAHDLARRLDHLQDGHGHSRFAAARFADQAEDLAFANVEVDVVGRDDGALG